MTEADTRTGHTNGLDPEDDLFHSSGKMAIARNYNDWTFALFSQYVRGKVLEVGCGVGSFTERLIQHGNFENLLSIDLSQDAVNYCRGRLAHPAVRIERADVNLTNGAYDLIVCMNVLEHIEDDRSTLEHMWGLLSPAGILFLLVPAHQFLFTPYDTAVGHYRRYTRKGMRRLFAEVAENDAAIVEQYYFNIVGALGSMVVYSLLRKIPDSDTASEIGFFDRSIVPLMRRIEPKWLPMGLSLVTVARKAG